MAIINKSTNKDVLMRTWRKGNTFAVLVGMQIGVTTVDSSMEMPQKLKMNLHFDPTTPLQGIYLKEPKTLI